MSATGRGLERVADEMRLTKIERRGKYWLCRCVCGVEKDVRADHLASGATRSCGCLQRERTIKRSLKHGNTRRGLRTTEYGSWAGMRSRCTNPNDPLFPYYGGRGITFDSRWEDFTVFLADMGYRPSPQHSIDRIDNNKGYAPENCRWATRAQQSRNKRSTRWITYNGRCQPLIDWAATLEIPYKALHQRLARGWSVERAFEETL